VGDRIINEHDESGPDADEELYLVLRGRATFELDGDRVAAATGTFVFAAPGVKRTAYAEAAERDANWSRLIRSTPASSTTWPVARASQAGRATRSSTSDSLSTTRSGVAGTPRTIRTSIRSATSPRSRR
jgi:hypothetical protein